MVLTLMSVTPPIVGLTFGVLSLVTWKLPSASVMTHGQAVLAGAGAVSEPELSTMDATVDVDTENEFVVEYVSK
jgi:hypothetical protein